MTIGEGRGSYRSLSDGDTVTLVHGAQGGFHVEVGLEAENIDASDLISGRIEGLSDGRVIADSAPWLDFRCNPDVPALQSWGTRLIFAMTPSELDGLEVTVQVSLTDVGGTKLSAERVVVIEDVP